METRAAHASFAPEAHDGQASMSPNTDKGVIAKSTGSVKMGKGWGLQSGRWGRHLTI